MIILCVFGSFSDAKGSFISESAKKDTLLYHAIENLQKFPQESLKILEYYYNNLSACENPSEVLYNYAKSYYLVGKMDSVRSVLDRHIEDLYLIRERKFYGRVLHLYSVLHKQNSLYSESLKYQFKALEIAKTLKDTLLQVTCQNSISGIHFVLQDFEKAKFSLQSAIQMIDSSDNPKKYHDMTANLATIYCQLNQYTKALNLLKECEKWYLTNNFVNSVPAVYNLIHGIHAKRQQYDSALYYAKSMLKYNSFDNLYTTAVTYSTLATAYENTEQFEMAHKYYAMAISIAEEQHYISLLLHIYKNLYLSYEKQGKIESAFHYLKKLRDMEEVSDKKSVSKTFEIYEVNNKLNAKDSALAKIESSYYSYNNILKTITFAFGFCAIVAFVFNHRKHKKLQSLIEEKEKIETTLKEAENLFASTKSDKDNDSKLARCIYREFRDQIQAIMFSSDVLETEIKKKSFAKNYSAPIKILNQTSGLLRNFLNYMILYNDLNNGEIKIHLERANISEITDRCFKILKSKFTGKKLNLIHIHNFYTSVADRNLVEFIIMCLLSNACKYSRPNSNIEIKYELLNGTLFVTVSDSGLGIDSNAINIENPDRIRSRPGTHGEKGTGMSLIIAHKMAKLMGAKISYQNNPDRGASFTLVLPNSVEIV